MLCRNSSHLVFLADIAEDDPEPDDGDATEMNFFYIRQFQVHFKLKSKYLLASYLSALTFFHIVVFLNVINGG